MVWYGVVWCGMCVIYLWEKLYEDNNVAYTLCYCTVYEIKQIELNYGKMQGPVTPFLQKLMLQSLLFFFNPLNPELNPICY